MRRKGSKGQRVSVVAKLALIATAALLSASSIFVDVDAFHMRTMVSSQLSATSLSLGRNRGSASLKENQPWHQSEQLSRRDWLSIAPQALAIVAATTTNGSIMAGSPEMASASESGLGEVTDKVFVDVSGLSASASAETGKTQRIVLGLFGKDAPSSVKQLKLLHGTSGPGLPAPCKPLKEDFLIQREQLEANKIYRSCIEGQAKGVTYDYAQVWRIIKDERIDFGSLSGKFNAREYPTWAEKSYAKASDYTDRSASKYLVAVRKGSDSGFGYTLFPTSTARSNQDFLENYMVVGSVLDGEDVVDQINNVSVVASAKSINYMSIVGGGSGSGSKTNAPKKDCRYGGPMYCNENKPLTKLTMFRTGIL
uniref:PPIase cyclophilin-type domain-containing protein n=1 Tax=Pseudo-nitzschia delicatissima TaxID=44447 RepID=A0A7S0XQQ4_9STRA